VAYNHNTYRRSYVGGPDNLGIGQTGQKSVFFLLEGEDVTEEVTGCKRTYDAAEVFFTTDHLATEHFGQVAHSHANTFAQNAIRLVLLVRHCQLSLAECAVCGGTDV